MIKVLTHTRMIIMDVPSGNKNNYKQMKSLKQHLALAFLLLALICPDLKAQTYECQFGKSL